MGQLRFAAGKVTEGNCRSGVALAMWYIHLRAQCNGLSEVDEHPAYAHLMGMAHLYL